MLNLDMPFNAIRMILSSAGQRGRNHLRRAAQNEPTCQDDPTSSKPSRGRLEASTFSSETTYRYAVVPNTFRVRSCRRPYSTNFSGQAIVSRGEITRRRASKTWELKESHTGESLRAVFILPTNELKNWLTMYLRTSRICMGAVWLCLPERYGSTVNLSKLVF